MNIILIFQFHFRLIFILILIFISILLIINPLILILISIIIILILFILILFFIILIILFIIKLISQFNLFEFQPLYFTYHLNIITSLLFALILSSVEIPSGFGGKVVGGFYPSFFGYTHPIFNIINVILIIDYHN